MSKVYKVIRATLFTLLILAVVLPFAVYVALSTPWGREQLRNTAEDELSRLLGTDVTIGEVVVIPFNRLVVRDISANDDYGVKAASIKEVSARFEMMHFLSTGRIVIDYAAIDGLDAKIYKKSDREPLNIAGIIERLQSKDTTKREKHFDLAISTVTIRNARASYDVLDAPRTPGRFNAKHVAVTGMALTAFAPRLSDKRIHVDLQDFKCREQSGLEITGLEACVRYTPRELSVENLRVMTPGSELTFAPIEVSYPNPQSLNKIAKEIPVGVVLKKGSHVKPADFKALLPALQRFDTPVFVDFDVSGTLAKANINDLNITTMHFASPLEVNVSGAVDNLSRIKEATTDGLTVTARIPSQSVSELLNILPAKTAVKVRQPLTAAGDVSLAAVVRGGLESAEASVKMRTSSGTVDVEGVANRLASGAYDVSADARVENLELGRFLNQPKLGSVTAEFTAGGTVGTGIAAGKISMDVSDIIYEGRNMGGITLDGEASADKRFNVSAEVDNDYGRVALMAHGSYDKNDPMISLSATIVNVDAGAIGLKKYSSYRLSGNISAEMAGRFGGWLEGFADVGQVHFHDTEGVRPPMDLNHLRVDIDTRNYPNRLSIDSDILNGHLDGRLNIYSIGRECKSIIASVMPALFPHDTRESTVAEVQGSNDFTFEFTVASADRQSVFVNAPVQIVYPVNIDGRMNFADGILELTTDALYLQQGDKIIDNTTVNVTLDSNDGRGNVYVTTHMPTQKGPMAVVAALSAARDRIDTKVNWVIERAKPINGDISFSTLLGRDDFNALTADVNFNRSDINFGNDTWTIAPSRITWRPKELTVTDFVMRSGNQAIHINGAATDSPDSQLSASLLNIQTVKIFETLDIDNALIGGEATGNAIIRNLFGTEPELSCNDMHVRDISYNYCVLGDADLSAKWDTESKSVLLDADITEPGGKTSRLWGSITPAGEKLDLNIDADHVRIGFLKQFMKAFAADVDGYASGKAHLYGTFKYIDMTGDLFAEKMGLKIGFTNTWYYAENDSVHIRPGVIDIKDIRIKDVNGNSALLNGYVKHTFFKEPVFDFRVTQARDFLCYDVPESSDAKWYGHILGNGTASITGHPGVVNIGVDMATAPGSKFTFVLSDTEEADEYNFVQFRDVTPHPEVDSIIAVDPLPAVVREYRDRQRAKALAKSAPSDYNMDFQVDITPDANIVLVMDPVGGDEINCVGKGNLRMTYASAGNDLHMYGSYTIDRGKYNFTLQDIIVKDFIIKDGSSITFTGDPYAANLDIKAVYNVNANLSDLDESFLSDRDLARTNVPVHAVLMAKGDMRQPDVSFDLEFPSLTGDIDRKVKSIISTDEMMNRQIIYLLALNRFYTPDYMQTTKGNELFSVASSTLSSQLSSMLGKLNNNISIAPNVRSDRGDFSDLEVDLALSGTLLNNRLRLNGNFGYRDRTVNTNQFIGDVDIEYLLNKSGTWRLKAYNRYNDQNYYLRTAQTTQGVGIMYKRDFDNLFGIRHRHRTRVTLRPDTTAADTTVVNSATINN